MTAARSHEKKTKTANGTFLILQETRIPVTTHAPVPWISALKVQYFCQYLFKSENAFLVVKSSNLKIL